MFKKKYIKATEDEWIEACADVVQDAQYNFEPEERDRFATYSLYFSFLLKSYLTEKPKDYARILRSVPMFSVSDCDNDFDPEEDKFPLKPLSINELPKKDRKRILNALKELFNEDNEGE